jgi:hypothetical protein
MGRKGFGVVMETGLQDADMWEVTDRGQQELTHGEGGGNGGEVRWVRVELSKQRGLGEFSTG